MSIGITITIIRTITTIITTITTTTIPNNTHHRSPLFQLIYVCMYDIYTHTHTHTYTHNETEIYIQYPAFLLSLISLLLRMCVCVLYLYVFCFHHFQTCVFLINNINTSSNNIITHIHISFISCFPAYFSLLYYYSLLSTLLLLTDWQVNKCNNYIYPPPISAHTSPEAYATSTPPVS